MSDDRGSTSPAGDLAATDLVLVRHAKPVLKAGVPSREWRLERESVSAARALATEVDRLLAGTGRRVSALWSSTEPKAVDTARAMGEELGLPDVTELAGLDEHRRGALPVVGDVEWRETIRRLFDRPGELVLGEETADEARARFGAAIESVVAGTPAGGVSVVATHATVMTLLLAEPNGLEPIGLWSSLGMPDALFVDSRGLRLLGRAWQATP